MVVFGYLWMAQLYWGTLIPEKIWFFSNTTGKLAAEMNLIDEIDGQCYGSIETE